MNSLARKALDVADRLWVVVDQIEKDDRATRSADSYNRGYISKSELDILNEAINILLEYGRGRADESFVDEYEAYE